LVPLAEQIQDPDFAMPEAYDRPEPRKWSTEEYIACGKWVVGLLSENSPQSEAQERISYYPMKRLSLLGFCPHPDSAARRFGSLWAYGEALGVGNVRSSEKYNDWTIRQFVSYAALVAQELGRKPMEKDYDARFKALLGPRSDFITNRVGSNRRLNDLIGYPNIHDWDDDDYIQWGAKVIIANGGDPLTARLVRHLSKLKRGPGDFAVYSRFGSLSKLQRLAADEALAQVQEQAERNESLMAQHNALVESKELVLPENLKEPLRLQITAQYLVIRQCVPKMDMQKSAETALVSQDRFMSTLLAKNPRLTAGFVETTAVTLGLFDYIWPMDEWRRYLKVSREDLFPAKHIAA